MNDRIFPDIKSVAWASKWEIFKARLFGKRVYYEDGYPMGYMYKGILFILNDSKEANCRQ